MSGKANGSPDLTARFNSRKWRVGAAGRDEVLIRYGGALSPRQQVSVAADGEAGSRKCLVKTFPASRVLMCDKHFTDSSRQQEGSGTAAVIRGRFCYFSGVRTTPPQIDSIVIPNLLIRVSGS